MSVLVTSALAGIAAFAMLLSSPDSSAAQVMVRHARASGLADAHHALLRGAYAAGVDPSALAPLASAVGTTAFEADWVLPSLVVRMGLNPVTLGALAEYSGRTVPSETRREWLRDIAGAGAENGVASADLTVLSVRRGRFGLRWTTSARTRARLNVDAAEAVLFGNSGRTGEPRELEFSGSELTAWSATTLSLGAGARLDELGAGKWGASTAVGMTARWIIGHGLITGRDAGSTISADPVALSGIFPIVRTAGGAQNGSGWGFDAGIRTHRGPWTAVLQIDNIFADFGWSDGNLTYRPGVALLGPETSEVNNPPLPLARAPGSVRAPIESFAFGRTFRLAGARAIGPSLNLAAAVACRRGANDGIEEDRCHVGAAVERTWDDRLRGTLGAEVDADALSWGLGTSVRLGRIIVDVSGFRRFGGTPESGVALGIALGSAGRPLAPYGGSGDP